MKKYIAISLLLAALVYTVISCKPSSSNNVLTADGNYPPEIAKIIVNKCAISGCHNAASYLNSDSLLLDTWEHLFQGSGHGSVVIPYNTQYSVLLYRTNTDPTLGLTIAPSMPFSADGKTPPLTKTEYLTLSNWIAKGAPDKYGNIPFASDADTRQKLYLTEQGCDLVSVIDAKSMLVMRYIPVGMDPSRTESPHSITVSSDGMSVYVCFYASDYIQKIDTRTDTVVASIKIGSFLPGGGGGSWGIISTSPAADTAVYVTNYQDVPSGAIDIMRANPFQDEFHFSNSALKFAHGLGSNYNFDTLFITAEYGNCIYKFARKALDTFPQQDPVKKISIDRNPITEVHNTTTPDPHEIEMSPDYSKYFVTCQNTNEVRVMDAYADTLIAVIPVGIFPQECAMSNKPETPYLFVACMLDVSTHPGATGSVYVINYNTLQVVSVIYGDFARPHDVAVDDRDGLIFIPSQNSDPNGPPPHHATACGGRAGWYSVYKFGPNSFTPANSNRYETTVQPYSIGVRFEE